MIKKINRGIRQNGNFSIFRDTKTDILILSKLLNEAVEKIDEMADVINGLLKEKEKRCTTMLK